MKIDFIRILTYSSMIIIIAMMIVIFPKCQCAPKIKNYEGRPKACYDFDLCMYRNQKNPDKSVCVDIGKECRAIERYMRCNDPACRAQGHDFEKCWLYLNQK